MDLFAVNGAERVTIQPGTRFVATGAKSELHGRMAPFCRYNEGALIPTDNGIAPAGGSGIAGSQIRLNTIRPARTHGVGMSLVPCFAQAAICIIQFKTPVAIQQLVLLPPRYRSR
jgi:hypothetical protein